MGSRHLVELDEVWRCLDHCCGKAKWSRRSTKHYWRVTFNGKTYATLPLGEHGNRNNAEVEAGHVRKMARHLGIYECVRKTFNF